MAPLGSLKHLDSCFIRECQAAAELCEINLEVGLTHYERIFETEAETIQRILRYHGHVTEAKVNNRQCTAYNAHKSMLFLDNLIRHNHDDLTEKERVGAKQALDVATKIYNRRKTEVEKCSGTV